MANRKFTKFINSIRFQEVSIEDRCSYFRKSIALYLFYYYLPFVPNFFYIFGAQGMVDRTKIGPLFAPSLLFLFESDWSVVIALMVLLGLSVLLLFDCLPRLGILILFLLNLSFQNANPYILHEPQQFTSLFLLIIFLFLPVGKNQICDPFIWKTLLYALGIYYMFAGYKKLIDPLWGEGQALLYLLQWDGLAKDNFLSRWLLQHKQLIYFLNYSALFFEMTFLLVCFTRFFRFYWLLGIFFHVSILCFLEVGSFSAIMFAWYSLFYPSREFKPL